MMLNYQKRSSGMEQLHLVGIDKLIDVIEGRIVVSENPNGSASGPIQNIIRIKCN